MKSIKKSSYLFLLFFLHLSMANAQIKTVDQDMRIKKLKKEIIKYLSHQIQGIKIVDSVAIAGDEARIVIKKPRPAKRAAWPR
jgi:hypothetical protein